MRAKAPEIVTLTLLIVVSLFPPWRVGDYTRDMETGARVPTMFYDHKWAFFLNPPSSLSWCSVDVWLLLIEVLIIGCIYFLLHQLRLMGNKTR